MYYVQNQERLQTACRSIRKNVCSRKPNAEMKKIITPDERSGGAAHSSRSHLKGQVVQ